MSAQSCSIEVLSSSSLLTAAVRNGRLYVNEHATALQAVISAAISPADDRVAATTRQKEVVVLSVTDKQLPGKEMARHVLTKRPTSITFSACGTYLLVSDAFGDVYQLQTDRRSSTCRRRTSNTKEVKTEGGEDVDNDKDKDNDDVECTAALGHFSTVTQVTVTPTHVITCDRDGRIRLSRWPHTYVIDAFCLGHSDVVTSARARGTQVVSASADGSVRVWSAKTGRQTAVLHVNGCTLSDGRRVSDTCRKTTTTTVGDDARGGDDDGGTMVVTDVWFVTNGCGGGDVDADGDAKDAGVVFTVHGSCCVFRVRGLVGGIREDAPVVDVVAECGGVVTGLAVDDGGMWVSAEGCDGLLRWFWTVQKGVGVGVQGGKGREFDGEVETTGEPVQGRFDWLVRQRKKEMVEDWKGKKRKHVEV